MCVQYFPHSGVWVWACTVHTSVPSESVVIDFTDMKTLLVTQTWKYALHALLRVHIDRQTDTDTHTEKHAEIVTHTHTLSPSHTHTLTDTNHLHWQPRMNDGANYTKQRARGVTLRRPQGEHPFPFSRAEQSPIVNPRRSLSYHF